MTDQPPTEQQLDEIETRHTAATKGPWKRAEDYSDVLAPDGTQLASYWRPADGEFIAHAPEDVRTLLDTVRQLRADLERRTEDVAFLERTTLPELRREIEHHKDGKQRWRERAEKAEAALDRVRRIASRLANHAAGFQDVLDESDRGPWGRTVGADIAELSAAVAPDAASEATSAPLSPVQPSGVSESAQSPTGTVEGARRALTPGEYNAAWHAVEGAAGDEGADPGTVLHAVLDRLGIEWQDAAQPTA